MYAIGTGQLQLEVHYCTPDMSATCHPRRLAMHWAVSLLSFFCLGLWAPEVPCPPLLFRLQAFVVSCMMPHGTEMVDVSNEALLIL